MAGPRRPEEPTRPAAQPRPARRPLARDARAVRHARALRADRRHRDARRRDGRGQGPHGPRSPRAERACERRPWWSSTAGRSPPISPRASFWATSGGRSPGPSLPTPGPSSGLTGARCFSTKLPSFRSICSRRLLRALESRKVRRVGGKVDRRVDVRVVAATHRDLRAEVAAGRFREDLYFRLAVAVVQVPPLRQRLEELPDLVSTFLRDMGRGNLEASEPTLRMLRAHAWPGNVRELKNTLACAVALVDDRGRDARAPPHPSLGRDGCQRQAQQRRSTPSLSRASRSIASSALPFGKHFVAMPATKRTLPVLSVLRSRRFTRS